MDHGKRTEAYGEEEKAWPQMMPQANHRRRPNRRWNQGEKNGFPAFSRQPGQPGAEDGQRRECDEAALEVDLHPLCDFKGCPERILPFGDKARLAPHTADDLRQYEGIELQREQTSQAETQ